MYALKYPICEKMLKWWNLKDLERFTTKQPVKFSDVVKNADADVINDDKGKVEADWNKVVYKKGPSINLCYVDLVLLNTNFTYHQLLFQEMLSSTFRHTLKQKSQLENKYTHAHDNDIYESHNILINKYCSFKTSISIILK
ncbi:hypothetical protein C0J52_19223 [Blattella germanica]|nr:hypothetical protein C0J52_19223 [Blattella germanica]